MSDDQRALNGRQPQAIRHAFAALRCVAQQGPGTTAQDVARTLGVSPATAYRLLNFLVAEEYLVRLADISGFALGGRVAELTGAAAEVPAEIPAEIPVEARRPDRRAVSRPITTDRLSAVVPR